MYTAKQLTKATNGNEPLYNEKQIATINPTPPR